MERRKLLLNPTRIYGIWDEGIVLDNHMLKSIFIGYDDNGKEKFQNTRTEIGELLYRFKYKNDKKCLYKIMGLVKEVLVKWNLKNKIDLVIPVPPSNKNRQYQPVIEIAKEVAKYLDKEYNDKVLANKSTNQAKDGNIKYRNILQIKNLKKLSNILIVDDLYSTGTTLNETCKVLKEDKNINKIYCLVITKTKR